MAESKHAGLHEDLNRGDEIKGGSDRSFGLVFAAVFAIIALWPLTGGGAVRLWALGIAAAFFIIALIRAELLAPINRVWTKFGVLLSRIVNPLVMALLFYLVITPTALVFRLLGKDPLKLRLDRSAGSYWIDRDPPGPDPDSMPHQF